MYGGYGSPPPELSNNPFLDSSALNRFPDVSQSPPITNQYTSWQQQPMMGSYNPQVPQQQYQSYNQQSYNQGPPPQSPVRQQFQPSSSFGQQLSSHLNGMPQQSQFTGYPQQQQIPQAQYNQTGFQPQPTGYMGQNYGGGMQQQPQQQIGGGSYLSEFDPYASIGQGWDGTSNQNRQQQQPQQQSYAQPTEHLHPREFIRKYKAELEAWDTYSWKQMQNAFEALKDAWEKRMHEIEARLKQVSTNWGMAAQQETQQGQHV
jgi:hypothetical protein